jgi:hypothetical protein
MLAEERRVSIYALGLLNDEDPSKAKQARHELSRLTETTGGVVYCPDTIDEVGSAAEEVARQIRNQYTLAYEPTNQRSRRFVSEDQGHGDWSRTAGSSHPGRLPCGAGTCRSMNVSFRTSPTLVRLDVQCITITDYSKSDITLHDFAESRGRHSCRQIPARPRSHEDKQDLDSTMP